MQDSYGRTVSPSLSMTRYFSDSKDVVQFVDDIIRLSKQGSQLSMTITRDASGAFAARTAIVTELEDIETLLSLGGLPTT